MTRRPFDTPDQLDDRLARAERAFVLAYELGTRLVLARVGGIPAESDVVARETFLCALRELGRRAAHRGVRLAVETGPDSGEAVRALLDGLAENPLAASIDPAALLLVEPVVARLAGAVEAALDLEAGGGDAELHAPRAAWSRRYASTRGSIRPAPAHRSSRFSQPM